jgi:Domain of unknown function (DUF4190)
VTSNGTHTEQRDPFGGNTFNRAQPAQDPRFPHSPRPPDADATTLATLSIVFAFVFAPVGVVLGHLALSQIKLGRQQGRDRALVGLSLSYAFSLFVVVALLLWTITAHSRSSSTATPSTAAAPSALSAPVPEVETTVVTPAPPVRRTVTVDELHAGDCVEIQQTQPDPNNADGQLIKIYPVNCQVRDGVFHVDVVSSSNNPCGDEYLANPTNTIVACITKFKG